LNLQLNFCLSLVVAVELPTAQVAEEELLKLAAAHL
jgi:hypothetical protein